MPVALVRLKLKAMSLLALYARVLGELGSERRLGVILALANILLAGVAFAEPMLFGALIDRLTAIQTSGNVLTWSSINLLIFAWVGFGLINIAMGVFVALHADRLAHRSRLAVMARYFEHALSLPIAYHTQTHSGRVLKVMLDGTNAMWALWLSFFREHCASFVALFVLLPFTIWKNWQLGLLLVCLVLLFGSLTAFVLRKTDRLQSNVEAYHSNLAERASDALGNVPVIQSFTRIEAEVRGLRSTITNLLNAQLPVLSWWAVANVATRASATLTVLLIFIVGTWLLMHGQTTVGEIVTFMGFATMLVGRLEQIVGFVNFIFMQAPKMREFFEVLDTLPSVRDLPTAKDPGRLVGAVAFEDVSFSYDGKRAAVRDVSFTVKPGETIAIVGSTGSGKSTALGLLHRAFDPQSGRIVIDGNDIRDISLLSLRRNVGVVFQEPMLFARSIRENLLVGKPDATDAELMEALDRAQATEVMARQPDGLDTLVGERGRTLSGGERQRLSIARALLKNPPVLILDEATSALDAATEVKLQKALEEVMKGRTTFVIAHRLATIRNADRILVFEQGQVDEMGSFDELVAKGGRFAALARAQYLVSDKPSPLAEGEASPLAQKILPG
ncbi:Beta-(1--_2)glucan export ATP-binding/permease protein NdvA [Hyphomicrobiales bacterium]|nr:Beta-(1-->2)glucan export ATP-binding/permease protein NdvA [Hyphomicrobiales bacterium]CAH1698552.1 Beta-(1-->2)glucan export ATP-binding/permease protein NdvA [Hyphomicrobiales bacterium]CAI0342200.1 Beta-(1-->2)glucan export ATP-binding/permease protein NdvA [Hyphomicrobiales bacterium]